MRQWYLLKQYFRSLSSPTKIMLFPRPDLSSCVHIHVDRSTWRRKSTAVTLKVALVAILGEQALRCCMPGEVCEHSEIEMNQLWAVAVMETPTRRTFFDCRRWWRKHAILPLRSAPSNNESECRYSDVALFLLFLVTVVFSSSSTASVDLTSYMMEF